MGEQFDAVNLETISRAANDLFENAARPGADVAVSPPVGLLDRLETLGFGQRANGHRMVKREGTALTEEPCIPTTDFHCHINIIHVDNIV